MSNNFVQIFHMNIKIESKCGLKSKRLNEKDGRIRQKTERLQKMIESIFNKNRSQEMATFKTCNKQTISQVLNRSKQNSKNNDQLQFAKAIVQIKQRKQETKRFVASSLEKLKRGERIENLPLICLKEQKQGGARVNGRRRVRRREREQIEEERMVIRFIKEAKVLLGQNL